jgi:hypothetical protein
MKNRARRTAFLALAEEMFFRPQYICRMIERAPYTNTLADFGSMDREMTFFMKHFNPDAHSTGYTECFGGGWWPQGPSNIKDRECHILALLLCAEMLRRSKRSKKKVAEVETSPSAEPFDNPHAIPVGWMIIPDNERIQRGDRFNSGWGWSVTNEPGIYKYPHMVYIRKIKTPHRLKPSIPVGYEEIFPGTILKEGDRFKTNVGWVMSTQIGEVIRDSNGFMTYIRKTKVACPVTINGIAVPEGWTVSPYGTEICFGDMFLNHNRWELTRNSYTGRRVGENRLVYIRHI